jgi:hypothetical protein
MTYAARMVLIRVTWRAHREYALALARTTPANPGGPANPRAPFELLAWVDALSILNRLQHREAKK